MLRNTFLFVFAAIAFVITLLGTLLYIHASSCIPASTVAIGGSTALEPLVQGSKQSYQHVCPFTTITIHATGSFNGLDQVEQGNVDIAMSDVFAKPAQNLEDHQVAIVPFVLAVNKDVDIANLTTSQIRGIYWGRYVDWNAVGSSVHMDIVRVSRPATSGTRATFEKYVLGGVETISGPQSLTTDTSEMIAQNVQSQPGAIGYVSLYFAKKYKLTILSIDGHAPTPALIKSDTYTFWNIEHMYTKKPVKGASEAFINHVRDATAQLIHDDGYLSLSEIKPGVLDQHERE